MRRHAMFGMAVLLVACFARRRDPTAIWVGSRAADLGPLAPPPPPLDERQTPLPRTLAGSWSQCPSAWAREKFRFAIASQARLAVCRLPCACLPRRWTRRQPRCDACKQYACRCHPARRTRPSPNVARTQRCPRGRRRLERPRSLGGVGGQSVHLGGAAGRGTAGPAAREPAEQPCAASRPARVAARPSARVCGGLPGRGVISSR